ncbi:hypothetical protein KBD34_00855 [Patescibacteria group bacterium]|nr:hypothetical protein [Patescibacteria group bacterium]
MLFRRSLPIGILLVSLALTGFGCKKIDTSKRNMAGALSNGQVKLPTVSVTPEAKAAAEKPRERKPERQPDAEILRIRDVLSSFQKSQTFRAVFTVGGKDGIKGDLSYNQQKGAYGKLSLKNGQSVDMALQGTRVAIRNSSSTWQELTGTTEGDQMASLLTAVGNRGTLEPIYPSVGARYVSGTDDTTRDCRMHEISQFIGSLGGYQPIRICIKNGLPLYFSIPSEDGLVEIEYRDIDKPVEVFFPLPDLPDETISGE